MEDDSATDSDDKKCMIAKVENWREVCQREKVASFHNFAVVILIFTLWAQKRKNLHYGKICTVRYALLTMSDVGVVCQHRKSYAKESLDC